MTSPLTKRRDQSWFRPGLYVPVRHVNGVEVLSMSRSGVRVARTTIHGSAPELRSLAAQLVAAAVAAERADRARAA